MRGTKSQPLVKSPSRAALYHAQGDRLATLPRLIDHVAQYAGSDAEPLVVRVDTEIAYEDCCLSRGSLDPANLPAGSDDDADPAEIPKRQQQRRLTFDVGSYRGPQRLAHRAKIYDRGEAEVGRGPG